MEFEQFEILIVGSGFGAICCAIKLKEAGIHNFVMLEKEDDFGGTWYLNSYPGAQVDVQSYLYSFSFEPYDWSRIFAKQEEILAYTHHLLDHYDLRKHGRLSEEVASATFNESDVQWEVTTRKGNCFQAPVLINATGVLNTPFIPSLKGIQSFKGAAFHSSRWDHSFDYRDKRVAVIGTGASAVQIIPSIAADVSRLHVIQRTPHWILKRPDRPFKRWERKLLAGNKWAGRLYREMLFWKNEVRIFPFTSIPSLMKIFKLEALHHIKTKVKDKKLRKRVTPDFMLGCKRILISNEYYPALQRPNVELVTEGIEEINANGIRTKEGNQLNVDLIVYCTGFKAADFFPYDLIGRNGLSIQESWKNGGHAYLGTTIPGFPNFFIMAGPNTGIGHTSALHIAESQVNYIMDAILKMRKNKWQMFELKKEIEEQYNRKLHRAMSGTIWQTGGCKSWYQNAAGENTTLNPYSNVRYRKNTKQFREDDYELSG